MKKVYLLLFALMITSASFSQVILNAGMETWRSNSSGSETINAPTSWFGLDSLIIGVGESFLMTTGWTPQLFQSTTIKNTGSSSAKMMSLPEDTLGLFPGIMTNAQPVFNLFALLGGGDPRSAISFIGGTATTLRITSVSAYVEYFPGIDTITHLMGGADTGLFTVQAISTVGGNDSVVGTGSMKILPSATFTQVTVAVSYVDTVNKVNTVRITFASSGGAGANVLDSSTLYVDDVSMAGIPQTTDTVITNVTIQNASNDLVKVYPNPAAGIIHLDGPQNAGLVCDLLSVSGQTMATRKLTGSDVLDVSDLPAGLYFYTISDTNGEKVQRGIIAVNR